MVSESRPLAARPNAEDANVAHIFQDEILAINRRREALGRPMLPVDGSPLHAGRMIDAVGLSLSGGGVRSAAISLGVLQALNYHGALDCIDYLSTVSGGGYTGCSLTATMTASGGTFVFGGREKTATGEPPAADVSDTDAVGHIRNYSNYLIPDGLRDALTAAAIVVRGLVANTALVLPILLILAAVTIFSNPNRSALEQSDVFGIDLSAYLAEQFGITLIAALVALLLFFLWALYRSTLKDGELAEFRTRLPNWGAGILVAVAVIAFCEFQPFVIDGMFKIADTEAGVGGGIVTGLFTSWVKSLAAAAAPIAAAVIFFQKQFGAVLRAATATSTLTTRLSAVAIKAAIWVAGAALPLVLWVAYLYLSYWGIINDKRYSDTPTCLPGAVSAPARADAAGAIPAVNAQPAAPALCPDGSEPKPRSVGEGTHTPRWLIRTATFVSRIWNWALPIPQADSTGPAKPWIERLHYRPVVTFYAVTGLLLFLLSWLLAANANSLYRLYRDRLSKAFLFDPTRRPHRRPRANEPSREQGRDFANLDRMKLSDLSDAHAPYHLINTALNIQGSDYANRRGRNADFFLFSKYWVGSQATGYASIADFEPAALDLDLATAMAISGAAASSNMGAATIRPLTPTLAILNVRLGYWLKNPAFWAPAGAVPNLSAKPVSSWKPRHRSSCYLWSEITGRLYENADEVYLTDGGHIENLGIYELLRRRCKVIVALDAEADFAMRLPAFITLQRYARIDLGVRINLPWAAIHATTLAWMQSNAGNPTSPAPEASFGPHVAIGTIDYGGGETGYLVYIKSSLTGDENDYVRDYAQRYSSFPHEPTSDQFFSEEQFEVYRALGFHMTDRFLAGEDVIAADGALPQERVTFNDAAVPVVAAVRAALLGEAAG